MARYIFPNIIEHNNLYIPAILSNSDYVMLLESGVEIEPWVEPTPEQLLLIERSKMNPFYTAFKFAMKATPAAGYNHLLHKVTSTVAAARTQDPFSDIVIWNDSVTQIIRLHPDMEAFRILFGLTETQLDDLCRLALQIEAGN